jgi:hypothetical protein
MVKCFFGTHSHLLSLSLSLSLSLFSLWVWEGVGVCGGKMELQGLVCLNGLVRTV